MSVQTSTFDAVFGNDPLGRFTAAIVTAVPEFDPGDTPIGHALASEFFQRLEPEAYTAAEPVVVAEAAAPTELMEIVAPVVPVEVVETTHVVLAPERVYEWPTADEPVRRPSPRPRVAPEPMVAGEEPMTEYEVSGTVLELPVGSASVEWFGAMTEPGGEIEERARRAS
jgi:hypothetical protein